MREIASRLREDLSDNQLLLLQSLIEVEYYSTPDERDEYGVWLRVVWHRLPFSPDDRAWIQKQLSLCDVTIPRVDPTWVTTERIR